MKPERVINETDGGMDVVNRNFFRLMLAGSLGEVEGMEPMSAFKWGRLCQMVRAQHVSAQAATGVGRCEDDAMMNIPAPLRIELEQGAATGAEAHGGAPSTPMWAPSTCSASSWATWSPCSTTARCSAA